MPEHAPHPAMASIEAPIVYLIDMGVTPVFHQSGTAADTMAMAGEREKRMMTVRNGRLHADPFSLDVEGFILADQVTRVTDFFDDAQLTGIYTSEIEALVTRQAGASKAVVFDHTRRSSAAATRDKHNARDPVSAAHADYTDRSAAQRLRDVLGDKAGDRLKRRFAIINVWRSMYREIEEWPLAVCDARSVADKDLHMIVRSAPHRAEPSFEYNRASETLHASYDTRHSWFYFPAMNRNEALVFKSYDTLRDGTARCSLHTALQDPTSSPVPAPRESIESRVLVFYD